MRKKLFSVTKNDFEIQTFRAGGPGGQNQNKRDTGVRLIHKASGARGEARDGRGQHENKMKALARLVETPTWKIWLMKEVARLDGKPTVEEEVEASMVSENLDVKVFQDGKWVSE